MQSSVPPEDVTPSDTPSTYNAKAFISEVYPTTDVDDEFIELYIPSSYSGTSISDWYLTTFDDEGLVEIPTITGIDGEDYIAIYTGNGTPSSAVDNGTAIVYLDLTDHILDLSGDEVGIFDSEGELIDFMVYEGGNGDDLFGDWPSTDEGPLLTTTSVSLFGPDTGDSTNWQHSAITPGMPNHFTYLTDSGYVLLIQSGENIAYTAYGIDDEIGEKNESILVEGAAGVPLDKMLKILEHIEFSLQYYLEKGFIRGPATQPENTIKIVVSNGTKTETIGKASTKGVITIKIGTIESDIDLKYVCEHELMHLFQFKTEKEGGDTVDHAPVKNKWWIEGQATYWGIESTKANFNLTNKQIEDEFKRVDDHNWYEDYLDLNRSIFIGWGKSYSDYMGSYLFMKFIAEKYGEDKLKEAFEKAKDNFNNNSKDVSPEDAIAEACGKTWEQLVAEFHAWMMTDAITDNGVPERKGHVNVTYTNDTVGDSLKVGPYGAGVERIKVNGTQPFSINFDTPPGSKWKITLVYVYEDGSREQAFNTPFSIYGTSAPWPVNPGAHSKKLVEIIVIKTLVQTGEPKVINMTVTPIENAVSDRPITLFPFEPDYWELPPLWGNYTTIQEDPWSLYYLIEYWDNSYLETIEIDPGWIPPDSFFDVMITLDDVTFEYFNVSDVLIIQSDPTWAYGEYLIEIRQSTWNSWVNGTITWHHVPMIGSAYEHPDHVNVGELRAADSNLWDYVNSYYYHVTIDDAFEYVFQIQLDAPFVGVGNWTLELYNMSHPDVVLRTTEGDYITDEWPRYLILPCLDDPDWSPLPEYIIRVVFTGGGTGNATLLTQPLEGTSIDNPLWHSVPTTQYFSVNLPYTYTGPTEVYINMSVLVGTTYAISFNASTPFVFAQIWDGSTWVDVPWDLNDGSSDWFFVEITALTDTLCLRIYPEMGDLTVFFLSTYIVV